MDDTITRFRAPTRTVAAVALLATLTVGCASMDDTQRRTATGAGIGAVAGAILGGATGGNARTGAVLGAAAGAAGGYIWSRRMEEQKRKMEQASAGTGVTVAQTADNRLRLEVPSDVSFDVGRAEIKPNLRPVLDRFATTLLEYPDTSVHVMGHTDSTGTDAVNDPLSVQRARSTQQYLVARGVPQERITIEGRGSRDPIASNDTDAGRAKNRRVEIYVAEVAQAR